MELILLDKSAWVRGGAGLLEYGELCMCAITRLEILYSARSAADFQRLQEDLAEFRDLRVDHATITAAESAQRELAGEGQHRVALPDLIIGACAQQHGADVLHVDRHFDVLAGVFGFRSIRHGAVSFDVRPIPIEDTRPLRHAVLRPHQAIDELAAHETQGAHAVGAFDGDELVSVGFVAPDEDGWRVRGMATAQRRAGRAPAAPSSTR